MNEQRNIQQTQRLVNRQTKFIKKSQETNHAPEKHCISFDWFYRQAFHHFPTTVTITRTSLKLHHMFNKPMQWKI